jgi:kumamolisin
LAALIALLNEGLGWNLGLVTPYLYALMGTPAFRQIVDGDNGGYSAGPDWNPCTGLGTPRGTELLERLRTLVAVGLGGAS